MITLQLQASEILGSGTLWGVHSCNFAGHRRRALCLKKLLSLRLRVLFVKTEITCISNHDLISMGWSIWLRLQTDHGVKQSPVGTANYTISIKIPLALRVHGLFCNHGIVSEKLTMGNLRVTKFSTVADVLILASRRRLSMSNTNVFSAISLIESGEGELNDHLEAWQLLVDTGICWQLQGWYGRTAKDLIAQGHIEFNN